MDVSIEKFVAGPLETNCYVVKGDGDGVLVFDPSSGIENVIAYLKENQLHVAAILLTHAHFDHILGIEELKEYAGDAEVWCHSLEVGLLRTPYLNGSTLMGEGYSYDGPVHEFEEHLATMASFAFDILHIPGHSPGGCAFVFGRHCIVGDILFAGSIGRSDLPGGDGELLVDGIRTKLLTLPEDTICYPGHGGRTTIAREKRYNPYLV